VLIRKVWYNTSMDTTYQTNNNIVYSCRYHIVWCPKYRRKVLVGKVAERLKELVKDICVDLKSELIEIEIMPDHIHLLVNVDPQFGVHTFIKNIKGKTSRILRNEHPHLKTKIPTLWTNSYFVSTVGSMSLETVRQYIEAQKTSQRK